VILLAAFAAGGWAIYTGDTPTAIVAVGLFIYRGLRPGNRMWRTAWQQARINQTARQIDSEDVRS
jgi:hypothetical protein